MTELYCYVEDSEWRIEGTGIDAKLIFIGTLITCDDDVAPTEISEREIQEEWPLVGAEGVFNRELYKNSLREELIDELVGLAEREALALVELYDGVPCTT